jgi:tRNA1(Val) A37 N6-methylase TrmN6
MVVYITESFYLLLGLLGSRERPYRIVDFGCGTGNLLLPPAALLPPCAFTGVEIKSAAAGLLQQRAQEAQRAGQCQRAPAGG